MKEILKELDVLLEANNQPYYNQIDEPLDKSEIVKLLDENKLFHCMELIELYSWHGWVNKETIYNGNYTELCSLGCLIDIKSAFEKFSKDKESDNYLDGKLPIVIRDDGDYMAVDLKKESPTRGFIYVCEPAITLSEEMIKIYDSIPLFLQTICECYKQKVYTLGDRYLNIDIDKEYAISKRMNPQSKYWVDDDSEMSE